MKNVKLNYTPQGYSYIKCTPEDCYEWGGKCICDDCNEKMTEEIYLIFILGRAYCKKCFDEWVSHSKKYTEDLKLQEERQMEFYNAYGFNVENNNNLKIKDLPKGRIIWYKNSILGITGVTLPDEYYERECDKTNGNELDYCLIGGK